MVSFLQENGFPMTIHIDTSDYEDPKEGFKGYKSVFTDDSGNVIKEFSHTDLRARIHFINGFYTAMRRETNWEIPLSVN